MAEDHRLGLLEQRVDHIAGVTLRVDTKLDGIAETLQSLARIEERQLATNDRLREGSVTLADHEERLKLIEVAMPGLKEARKWTVALVLASAAMIFVALAHMVITKGTP